MSRFICFSVIMLLSVSIFAQRDHDRKGERGDQMALITKRLDLTAEQAEKLGPVLKQMRDEIQEARKGLGMNGDERPRRDELDDAKADVLIAQQLDFSEKKVQITRSYIPQIKSIIGSVKTLQFIKIASQHESRGKGHGKRVGRKKGEFGKGKRK